MCFHRLNRFSVAMDAGLKTQQQQIKNSKNHRQNNGCGMRVFLTLPYSIDDRIKRF